MSFQLSDTARHDQASVRHWTNGRNVRRSHQVLSPGEQVSIYN